ncbi:MAG: hypothetical protein HYW06_12630, partial [Gemmatimonadetes bacterium]|nr:hypothetical protein [Gemmatimonadota bacterium]
QEHALGLAEAARREPVVDVVLAHVGQPLVEGAHLARADAVDGHEGNVEEGDRQDQGGCAERDQGVVPRPFPHDRQPCETEADEAGAPVPEEHLSGIAGAPGDLFISYVKQGTFVDVNEEGTEAAAATVVAIGLTSAGPQEFRVDRPFAFLIRERFSGTILFMGKIMNPAVS